MGTDFYDQRGEMQMTACGFGARMGRVLAAVALVLAAISPLAGEAAAREGQCRIGRPSYCDKYGGTVCEKSNALGAAACERWHAACFRCHQRIDDCTGGNRLSSASPKCEACSARWLSCMQNIDARYWPNRLSP